MSRLQEELTRLRTVIEQTLGPDGSVTKTLGEIKGDLKEGAKVMDDHALRLDRLEQKEKTRSKVTWAFITASVGMLATAFWNLIKKS
jgi:hypothetical protein